MPKPEIKSIEEHDSYFVTEHGNIFGLSKSSGLSKNPVKIFDKDDKEIKPKSFKKTKKGIIVSFDYIENTGTEKEPEYEQKTVYYNQSNKKIKELKDSELEEDKIETHITYNSDNFEVYTDTWFDPEQQKEITVSKIKNKVTCCGDPTYRMISGCFEIENGLWFSVADSGRRYHKEGLYFFPKNKKAVSFFKGKGKIY